MNKITGKSFLGFCLALILHTSVIAEEAEGLTNPTVVMDTSEGKIKLVLFQDKAPISVKNFLDYAKSGHYDGTIFHRVIAGFMIQGGGFTQAWHKKPTKAPIKNEAMNGLSNKPGTIAMARTSVVDSATSQFFINLTNNRPLNHGARDYGYAVFGEVVEGMDVVFAIGQVRTGVKNGRRDVPVRDVVIKKVVILQ